MAQFDYNSVEGDYQYKAMKKGPKLQRFWHLYKIKNAEDALPLSKKDILLDFGCGSGNIIIALSKKVKTAYGADISQRALDFVNQRTKKENIKNIKLIKLKDEKTKFKNNYFDKIILSEELEHLKKPEKIIEECYRILKPNGLLFITTPNYISFWPILEFASDLFKMTPKMGGEQHISKFSKAKLKKLLIKNNFKIAKIRTFYLISPFVSVFSGKLAKIAFKIETKQNIFPGMLIYTIAKK